MSTIFGGSGRDVLRGTDAADRIFGNAGRDRLFGYGGADTLIGGAGRDRLYGGTGDDFLRGRLGNDRLWGGSGHDTLIGGDGRDRLYGGHGDDVLRGGDGNDLLNGGAGDDTLMGGRGRDILTGGAGDDVFRFDDFSTGRASTGRADEIRDYSLSDAIDLTQLGLTSRDWDHGTRPEPGRFNFWQSEFETHVRWNTSGTFHDVLLQGFGWDDEEEPIIHWYKDDFPGHGHLAPGGTQSGTIEVAEDQDWFTIKLSPGQTYAFDLIGGPGSRGLTHPFLELSPDNESGPIAAGGGQRSAHFVYTQDPHTINDYVLLVGSDNHSIGTYHLSVTALAHYVDDYAGDDFTNGKVRPGQTVHGVIEISGDTDWFSIDLTEGETYRFDLKGKSSASGTLADPFLVLHDRYGGEIAFDENSGSGKDARIS